MSSQLPIVKGVYVLSAEHLTKLEKENIEADLVGAKAYGLLLIPPIWVPDFFVIRLEDIEDVNNKLFKDNLKKCFEIIEVDSEFELLLRSSGVNESLSERGSLKSYSCTSESLIDVLATAIIEVSKLALGSKVFWIIQKKIKTTLKGHLSNERRLSKAKRDWVLEVESTKYLNGTHNSIAVREWRDNLNLTPKPLSCDYSISISKVLKNVSIWAHPSKTRIHFEWVWDGSQIFLVQADISETSLLGTKPKDLVVDLIKTENINSLNCFLKADENDFKQYTKLRNARIYKEIGYKMPSFYILRDPKYVELLIRNEELPEELIADLRQLTKFPLVIRTDSTSALKGEKRMLPRSDELRSLEDALDWFTGPFIKKIKLVDHEEGELVLIAHHYMPAVASAWCRASPNDRQVRIESLWGLPDGLHWYSHDVHEVDTKSINFPYTNLSSFPEKTVGINKRIRFKGRFIAPNSDGKWLVHETVKPYDWGDCIKNKQWLKEISQTSRAIATKENSTVSVMWFIEVQQNSSNHKILPWYHERVDVDTNGENQITPRHKRQFEVDFIIKTTEDWELLKEEISSKTKSIKRICVIPEDPKIFRDQSFSNDLSKISKENDIVIELSGGILSHAYYMLTSAGVNVECVDLYGTSKQQLEFNKLVRDKIPSQIYSEGESVKHIVLKDKALESALKVKLVEEVFEVFDSSSHEELVAEIADVLEVISGIENTFNIDLQSMGFFSKRRERGGTFLSNPFFENRLKVEVINNEKNQLFELRSIIPLSEPSKGKFYAVFPRGCNKIEIYRIDFELTRKSLSLLLTLKISLVDNTEYLFVDLFGDDSETIKTEECISEESETASEKVLFNLKSEMITKAFDAYDSNDIETLKLHIGELLKIISKVEYRLQISHDEVETVKEKKYKKKGGFEDGLVLVETTKYQSLSFSEELPLISDDLEKLDVPKSLSSIIPLELNTLGFNVDLIHISGEKQRLIKVDSAIPLFSSKTVILPPLNFPSILNENDLYSIAIDLNRNGIFLTYKLEITIIPSQLEFEL